MLHVIDSQINRNLLNAAAAEFPQTDWPYWHHYDNGKLATHDESRIPPACRLVLHEMIKTIPVPDDCFADFSFYGAGLHCMPPGSSLGTHLDSQLHPNRRWLRTHSAVLFLNMGWKESWGGSFYSGYHDGINFARKAEYPPEFGRMLMFECDESAYHGVEEVQRRSKQCRNTLSVFFWRCLTPEECTIPNLRLKAHFI